MVLTRCVHIFIFTFFLLLTRKEYMFDIWQLAVFDKSWK